MPRPVRLSSAPAKGLATAIALAGLLAAPLPALAAGQVQVKWTEPEKFADAGTGVFERERNLELLTKHLEQLGRQLPDGLSLSVEVTDLELAGQVEPFSRFHQDVRILRGRADWPRISMRYTLSEGARTVASGEAELSDPHYFFRSLRISQRGALAYERRMLDDWLARLLADTGLKAGAASR